ncbi:MAG TPA: NUDIX domain-containing protein [candidate division Zixibacteria bacterium]|nr:NUDIX domain-containing protein [candidate division Zixibacteria bacterium]
MNDSKVFLGEFCFRVAGILMNKRRILLQTDDLVDFWVIPGGGVKLFESSEQAIKREFQEEMKLKVEVDRLLWIVENSFIFDNTKLHGIEFTFLVKPLNEISGFNQREFHGIENDITVPTESIYKEHEDLKLTFRWFKPEELDSITIKPDIYTNELKNIPSHAKLIRNLEITE